MIHADFFQFIMAFPECPRHSNKMAACRITNNTNLVHVNAIIFSIFTHQLNGSLHILQHCRMMIFVLCSAIPQSKSRNTLACKPFRRFITFIKKTKMMITSTRTNYYRSPSILSPSRMHIHHRLNMLH